MVAGEVPGACATDVGGRVVAVVAGGRTVDTAPTGVVVVGATVVVGAAVVVVGSAVKITSTVSTVVRSTVHEEPEHPGVLHDPNSQPDAGLAESEAVVAPSTSTVQSFVHEEPPVLVTVPPPVTRTRSDRAGTYDADAADVLAGVVDPGSR